MSRSAEIVLLFGGEERLFRLPIKRWEAIDEACDAGPMELLQRFVQGTWKARDLREVILHGLIGGGLNQSEAARILGKFFDDEPLGQFVPIAQAIVMASVVGSEHEDLGEPEAGEEMQPTSSPAESSGSDHSTASEP